MCQQENNWNTSSYFFISMLYSFIYQETAANGEHVWVDSNASGDFCYIGESECLVSHVFIFH